MKKLTLIFALGILAGCAGKTPPPPITRDVPVEVDIPVPQPCVVGTKPAAVVPLKDQISDADWAALDVKQKAAYIANAGLAHKTAGENLNGATAGCP